MTASNFSLIGRGSDEADEEGDQEATADGHDVLDETRAGRSLPLLAS